MRTDSGQATPTSGWPDITVAGVTGPFTGRAQAALDAARESVRTYRHQQLGTEHLLLGLLSVGDGVAAHVLGDLGITVDGVRAWIDYRIGQGDSDVRSGDIAVGEKARQALHYALEESQELGHLDIGTEHILLGVSRAEDGIGATILADSGVGYTTLREAVKAFLGQTSSDSIMVVCSLPPDIVAALDHLVQSGRFETRAEAAAWCIDAAIRTGLRPPG